MYLNGLLLELTHDVPHWGGTSKKFEHFQDALTVPTPIHVAKFLNNAGIIGAAVMAVQSRESGATR